MIKKLATLAIFLFGALAGSAQMAEQLPLSPDVKHGTLPNGMQYFIKHNAEPKERANFYIAQKVGSTLETPEQLGLAHFLEHMAFNGTKHYPGKAMLNYLQTKGIRFGADINAYTDFDETVYNIDNVPTTDKALMDSVLLVLHDWSCEISLETDEINAERGVIEEEWRSRNNAMSRLVEYILPKIYQEYNYQQTPIGKMEVVRNFKPEVLRDYYRKWYRPDQQGIVIVGDFDASEMEKKVIELFSPIVMPENAPARTYPTVSDNKEPIFVFFDDPEFRYPRVDLAFKSEKTPWEMRNTTMGLLQDHVLTALISQLINNRLDEFSQKPECKYAFAGVRFDNFWISKTKDAFNVVVVGKTEIKDAFNQAMGIIARACKTGFTDSELERVTSEMLAAYEKTFNEKDKTANELWAKELIRFFVDNNAAPGIEYEYNLVKQVLPNLPVQALNQAAASLLTPENQVLIVSQPKNDSFTPVAQEEMIPILENTINADYEAYVDEVITDPLLTESPKPGKIKSIKDGAYDTKEIMLSNGVKVVVKQTDFKADEIRVNVFRKGGKASYAPSQAANVLLIDNAFEDSKLGNFNKQTLKKYLAGKHVSLSYAIGNLTDCFTGSTTVKDLPTLMELLYASFTALGADQEAYNASIEQALALYGNEDKNAELVFAKHLLNASYGNNPMFQMPNTTLFKTADYNEMLQMIKQSTANAAEFTFMFVGNVDLDALKPLLENFVASLPAKKVKNAPVKKLSSIEMANGQIIDDFKFKMNTPVCQVYDIFHGENLPVNVENTVKVNLIGQLLRTVFTNTLREEMGGTYSPFATSSLSSSTGEWSVSYNFKTNDEMLGKMQERAYAEFEKLLNDGASEVEFNKVKEASIKQFEIKERSNGYWMTNLTSIALGTNLVEGYRAALDNLNLADFNDFMKHIYDGKNRVQVIMIGEKE